MSAQAAETLHRLAIEPACVALAKWFDRGNMASTSSQILLLRTAATESDLRHRAQFGGPARSLFQVEPQTVALVYRWARRKGPDEWKRLIEFFGPGLVFDGRLDLEAVAVRLYCDQYFAAGCARLLYWSIAEPMPQYGDVLGQAHYWKKFYNTFKGKGRVSDFMTARQVHLGSYERSLGLLR